MLLDPWLCSHRHAQQHTARAASQAKFKPSPKPSQVSSQVKSRHVKSTQAKSSQVNPSQVKSSHVTSSQATLPEPHLISPKRILGERALHPHLDHLQSPAQHACAKGNGRITGGRADHTGQITEALRLLGLRLQGLGAGFGEASASEAMAVAVVVEGARVYASPQSMLLYARLPYCSGSSTNSASGFSVSCRLNSWVPPMTTSAVIPRNILKPILAITSAVSAKLLQVPICALARNSSMSRTPML